MKELNFHSRFRKKMEYFVNLRRLSGTDYQSQIKLLEYFDHFLIKQYPDRNHLTPDVVQSYLETNQNLHIRSSYNRFCVVRQFCCYLSQFDQATYIPESRRTPQSNSSRIPYIFTKNEIKRLLAESTKLLPQDSLRPHTYHALFGLLYTTGLRIGEALGLNIQDFFQNSKLLYIRKGKFSKARWVPLSYSTYMMLEEYITLRQQTKKRKILLDSPLFISLRHKRLHHSTVYETFRYLLKQCDIEKNKDYGPRIHDFRHTFAVHRLIKWYREREDVQSKLPALATYMGHVDIRSSQIYLQATSELLEQGNQRFLKYFRQNIKRSGGFNGK